MGYYNEPYEEESRDENREFHDVIEDVLSKEIENRVSSIKNDYEYQKEKNKKLSKHIYKLENQLNELQKENKFLHTETSFINDVIKNLNEENISKFISLIYKPDFNEDDGMDKVPIWFLLEINYYSHKDKILDLLEMIGIKVPKRARLLKLPFEWDKEELNTFFNTMYNHTNTNGETYAHNLCFWVKEKWETPIENCKQSDSEIPWQFVLRNPLLNTSEYILKMAKAINNGHNGLNFLKILDYQNLSDKNLKLLIDNIKVNEKTHKNTINFLLEHIEFITDKERLNKIYPYVENKWMAEDYLYKMPKEYLKKYIKKQKKDKAKDIIFKSPLPKEEKIEMITEIL